MHFGRQQAGQLECVVVRPHDAEMRQQRQGGAGQEDCGGCRKGMRRHRPRQRGFGMSNRLTWSFNDSCFERWITHSPFSMATRMPTATTSPLNWRSTCASGMAWRDPRADDFGRWLAQTAHDNGLAIDLKNAGALAQYSDEYQAQLVDAFDFNVIESCVSHSSRRPLCCAC